MPSQKVGELAKMLGTDLIVMGTHGRTGLDHVLLGSTAERVVTTAPCPVMTIRLEKRDERSGPINLRGILAPIDFSDCSLEALDYGVQVAKQFGASLTILHVLEPVSYGLDFTLYRTAERESLKERTESRLAGLVEIVKSEGVPAHSEVRGGLPADTIVRAAHDSSYDLIVMGTHGRRGLSHVVSGSVAEAVLRRASCPVLMVKRQTRIPHHLQLLARGKEGHEKISAWRTTEGISTPRTTIDEEETQGDEPDRRNPGRSA
jgi:nucleotide-binding universal stress UspA family protein